MNKLRKRVGEVGVVEPVVKVRGLDMLEVARESIREATAEILNGGIHFLHLVKFVFSCPQSQPSGLAKVGSRDRSKSSYIRGIPGHLGGIALRRS